ncbi:MAG TPA: hypothetical protein VGZ51_08605, partial [Actinomycetota bacterium]|nr:hypothetical protein [Actinomycetota bacterium]
MLNARERAEVVREEDADHGSVWASTDSTAGRSCTIAVHRNEPDTISVVPIKSDSEHVPPDGKLRVYRSRTGGN